MIFILIATLIFLNIIIYFKFKSLFLNSISFIIIFWMIFLIISTFNPYKLYHVSNFTYLLFVVFLFFLLFGYLSSSVKSNNKIVFNEKKFKSSKFIFIVSILLMFYFAYYYFKYNTLLITFNTVDYRLIKFEYGYLFSSYLEYALFSYIAVFLLDLIILINTIKFSISRKFNFELFMTLLSIIIFALIGYGRLIIFSFIFIVIFSNIFIIIFNKKKSKINFTGLAIIILLGIIFMGMITLIRLDNNVSNLQDFLYIINYLIRQFTEYFIGPMRLFDIYLKNSNNDFTIFSSTFSGINELLVNFFDLLNFDFISSNSIISAITKNNVKIGEFSYMNAFYTSLLNFHLDGGIIGIIGYSYLLGYIIGYTEKSFIKNPNIYTFSIFLMIFKTSFTSIYRWEFISPSNWILIIVLVFFSRYKIKIGRDNN